MTSHRTRVESDEYFCVRCHCRWGIDEDAPEECTPVAKEDRPTVAKMTARKTRRPVPA